MKLKFLTPKMNANLDIFSIFAFAFAPTVYGFSGDAATLSYVLSAGNLLLVIFTKYPLGIVKLVPLKIHVLLEFGLFPLLLLAPTLLGFSDNFNAIIFFYPAAFIALGLWIFTDTSNA